MTNSVIPHYSKESLDQLSYKELVDLCKTMGVYNTRKSKKKAYLIGKVIHCQEKQGLIVDENTDPNTSRRETFVVKRVSGNVETRRETFTIASPAPVAQKRLNMIVEYSAEDHSDNISQTVSNEEPEEHETLRESFTVPVLTRQGTFTKESESESEVIVQTPGQGNQRVGTPVSKKTKASLRVEDLPTLTFESTPAKPIERLSVFERLSSTLPLSTRRSIINPRRSSNLNSTPQTDRVAFTAAVRASRTATPKARKAPNFALIHQKQFEKMESIVDAKKRVELRAALFSPPVIKSKTRRPTTDETSKIPVLKKREKLEALKMSFITKQRPKISNIRGGGEGLPGVRVNRRFQLQLDSLRAKRS